jgi:transposase
MVVEVKPRVTEWKAQAADRKSRGEHRQKGPSPEHLQRQRIVHDLAESEKHCKDCDKDLRQIGEEVSERYEYIPAQLKVVEDVCIKYACECTVTTATKPPQPIEKSTAGASLLTQVIVAKYADHLPLNRQEKMFRRFGVELPRQTLCGWMGQVAELLDPLVRTGEETGAGIQGGADRRNVALHLGNPAIVAAEVARVIVLLLALVVAFSRPGQPSASSFNQGKVTDTCRGSLAKSTGILGASRYSYRATLMTVPRVVVLRTFPATTSRKGYRPSSSAGQSIRNSTVASIGRVSADWTRMPALLMSVVTTSARRPCRRHSP